MYWADENHNSALDGDYQTDAISMYGVESEAMLLWGLSFWRTG
jgi:hypothetical protein